MNLSKKIFLAAFLIIASSAGYAVMTKPVVDKSELSVAEKRGVLIAIKMKETKCGNPATTEKEHLDYKILFYNIKEKDKNLELNFKKEAAKHFGIEERLVKIKEAFGPHITIIQYIDPYQGCKLQLLAIGNGSNKDASYQAALDNRDDKSSTHTILEQFTNQ